MGGTGGNQAACTAGAGGFANSHGHMIEIPQAHIDDPQDRTYSATGGDHSHSVDVTAAQLTELATNGVAEVSSNDTHAHTWMIGCLIIN